MCEVRDSVAATSRRRGSDIPAHPLKVGEDDKEEEEEEEKEEEVDDDDDDDKKLEEEEEEEEDEVTGTTPPNFLVHALRVLTTCIIAPMPSTYARCEAEVLE